MWAPLSEATGRRNVLLITLASYTLWTSVCAAAQNIQTMIVFRLLCGTIGSSATVVPSGIIADMFEAHHRGLAIAVFSAAPFLGPTLGPLTGGFLAPAAGWRWVFGLLGMYAASLTFLGFIFVPETYGPVLLRQRAQKMSQITKRCYMTQMDFEKPVAAQDFARRSLVLPWALLLTEPIVLILTIYISVIYGTLYLCFASYPIVFQEGRGWNEGQTGLAFLSILVGFMFGFAVIVYDNRRYTRIHHETGGFASPEVRLPPVIIGGGFAIAGLAWLAGTVGPGVPWPAPVLSGIPFGFGLLLIVMCCINYLIDSYVIYAASVMAANGVLRSLFGAVFPLFTTYMYRNLGVNWAAAVPGFIALACFPFPILFYKYGERIRRKCKYSAEAARLLDSMKSNLERQRSQSSVGKDDAC